MSNQPSKPTTIRPSWVVIAVVSGCLQVFFIICGGIFLSAYFDSPFLNVATGCGALLSLVWPVYVYMGMNYSYRSLLKEDDLRRIQATKNKSPQSDETQQI